MRAIFVQMREYDEKTHRESQFTLFDKFVFRPIGQILAASLLSIWAVTPNQITIMSVGFALIGSILLNIGYPILAFVFFLCFPILDCADGTLARYLSRKGSLNSVYGELSDAMGGYFFIVIFWLSLSLFYHDSQLISLICSLICALNLISRLYYNKLGVVVLKSRLPPHTARRSKLYNIYENLEFGSAMLPLALFSYYLSLLEYFVVLYFLMAFFLTLWCFRDFARRLQ